jgi:hypothetical protein
LAHLGGAFAGRLIAGKYDQLVGKVQERYGITREEAAKQLDTFARLEEARSRAQKKA